MSTSSRKLDHLNICLNEDVLFKSKTNGLERYDFVHHATTEIDFSKISLDTDFFGKKIDYPFLISCMTGGIVEAESINAQLAEVANILNIAVGVGSQRQALENNDYHTSYKIIREKAPQVPILGNIGAAQVASSKDIDEFKLLTDLIEADGLVVHLNPLQEVIQKEGDTNFQNLLKNIKQLVSSSKIPIIVKEVGSGIDGSSAKKLLEAGVKGIDIAGAGGTSWAAVEMKRNNEKPDNYFWNWGLPTSYCIREVNYLREQFNFTLIASGGISSGVEIAKSIALGADIAASASPILKELKNKSQEGTVELLQRWFSETKKIMFLTNSSNIKQLKNNKLKRIEDLY